MHVTGLCGGIGAGKSTVAGMLGERGAHVIDVDALGRRVLEPTGRAYSGVVDWFGNDVVGEDGTIDRGALAAIVFDDPEQLDALEAISHPAINADLDDLLAAIEAAETPPSPGRPGTLVVLDMAVLVESTLGQLASGRGYSRVLVVECPLDVRIERLIGRGMTEGDARARIESQATDDDRRAVADLVITNAGDLDDLAAEVDEAWQAMHAWATTAAATD